MNSSVESKQAYIFDFDGTIIQSNQLKLQAFEDLVKNDSVALDLMRKVLKASPRDPRDSLLQSFIQLCSQERNLNDVFNDHKSLLKNYSSSVDTALLQCDFVPGAIDFLKALKFRGKHLYLWSATPVGDLMRIADKLDISNFFHGIFGSPETKKDNLDRILKGLDPRDALVFGDSFDDLKWAKKLGVDFVAINNSGSTDRICEADCLMSISNFFDERINLMGK